MHIFKNESRVRIAGSCAAVMVLMLGARSAQADHAVLSVTSGSDGGCYDLLAGQTIDAGDVCYAVDGESLTVVYNTEGDWQLVEAHLWVGEDQDGYPMSKKGNPKIGNFPYNAGVITGASIYSFSVPLGSVQSTIDLDNLDAHCDESATIYAMAHAALQRVDADGNVIQTETGWGEGEGAVQRGSWATRTAVTLGVTCDQEPPGPSPLGQETALMFGNIVLNDETDEACRVYNSDGTVGDAFGANRWGWQAGPLPVGTYRYDIWAAAGKDEEGPLIPDGQCGQRSLIEAGRARFDHLGLQAELFGREQNLGLGERLSIILEGVGKLIRIRGNLMHARDHHQAVQAGIDLWSVDRHHLQLMLTV